MPSVKFNYKREIAQNPYTGIVSFQHFSGEKLYNDVICSGTLASCETENLECYPIPSGVKENGREQGWYPDNSVAYFRVLWKEFEPKQGEYNYQFIQDIIDKCKEHNQSLMFRLMPHSTCERDDVPDWLKDIMECPSRPDGMRVKDSPTDRRYLKIFAETIKKFAERFDKEPVLNTIDICLPGAWGEGHELGKYPKEDLLYIIDTYIESFPNTFIFGQIAGSEFMKHIASKRPVGWRADGVGLPRIMEEIIPKRLAQVPDDLWKTSPISSESYWWIGEWFRRDWDIDKIIETTLSWHISTFNPKSLPIPYEWKDKIEYWNSKMGYHYSIKSVEFEEKALKDGKLNIKFEVDNVGVAPSYHDIPLNFKIANSCFEKVFTTDIDIRKWLERDYIEDISLDLTGIPNDKYRVLVGIGGGNYPAAYFATDAEYENGYYNLFEFEII